MSPLPGRRVGVVVLTIEQDESASDALLIRVRAVDDVHGAVGSDERAFVAVEPAVARVREWLAGWTRA